MKTEITRNQNPNEWKKVNSNFSLNQIKKIKPPKHVRTYVWQTLKNNSLTSPNEQNKENENSAFFLERFSLHFAQN